MPEPQTPAAFISYCREDSEFALRLAQDLKAAGAPVWIDQLDIPAGINWDNAIEDALIASPRMLLILSPASSRSNNVRNEISFALEQTKIVIPVLYRDCTVPLQLQRANRIDFRADYARGLASLLANLQVAHPDPVVLDQIAQAEAQRKAAWQAREAEAQRLQSLESTSAPQQTTPPPEEDREAAFQRMRDEAFRRQKLEAEARQAEVIRQAQAAQFRAASPPPHAVGASKSSSPILLLILAGAIAVVLLIGLAILITHRPSAPAPIEQTPAATTAPAAPAQPSPTGSKPAPKPIAPKPAPSATKTTPDPKTPAVTGPAHALAPFASAATFQQYSSGCQSGDGLACYRLGDYYTGFFEPPDYANAERAYLKSCSLNNDLGCGAIGNYYRLGKGYPKDLNKARPLLEKACRLGDSLSCDILRNDMY